MTHLDTYILYLFVEISHKLLRLSQRSFFICDLYIFCLQTKITVSTTYYRKRKRNLPM